MDIQPNSENLQATLIYENRIRLTDRYINEMNLIQLVVSPNSKYIAVQCEIKRKNNKIILFNIMQIDNNSVRDLGNIDATFGYKIGFINDESDEEEFVFLTEIEGSITFSRDDRYLHFVPGTTLRIDMNKLVRGNLSTTNRFGINVIKVNEFIRSELNVNLDIMPENEEVLLLLMDYGKPTIHHKDIIGFISVSDKYLYYKVILYDYNNNKEIIRHHIDSEGLPQEFKILPGKLGNIGATHYIIDALSRSAAAAVAAPTRGGTRRRKFNRNKTRKGGAKPSDILHDIDALEMLNEFEEDGKIAVLIENGNIVIYSGTSSNNLLQTLNDYNYKSMIFSNDGNICYTYCENPNRIVKYVSV
jgi:hypothetical protein